MGDSMSKARDEFEAEAGRRAEAARKATAKENLSAIRDTLGAQSLAGRVWDKRLPFGVRQVLCEAARMNPARREASWDQLSEFERSKLQGAAVRLREWAALMSPDMGGELDALRAAEDAAGEGAA
jgi:hypothetical protein